MSLRSRITNIFHGRRLTREIDDELQSHIEEAIEQGRDPVEARRAFGSPLRHREASLDIRLLAWLDSLRADAVFGWRQLTNNKVTSAAAVLSLALAIGSCTSAFRLIDALLWRPLPVANPERLYALSRESKGPDGKLVTNDNCAYPMFQQMRARVKGQAELIAVSGAAAIDLTYGSDQDMEKAHQQYISGWMFTAFGLHPAWGRLFTASDDIKPGAHPYAVLSYDYWTRRFGQDPKVIGRTFRWGTDLYEIVGVAPDPFTGTEPGAMTDIFIPTMMAKNDAIVRSDYRWFRTLVKLNPGVPLTPVHEKLRAAFRAFLEESVKQFAGLPKLEVDGYLSQTLSLNPGAAGVSGMQKEYRRSLMALAALVALVLLIACANVANLLTAQAASRAREMALRVSIGAGQWRLAQLLFVESAILGLFAAGIGGLFAWWSAPFVVSRINPPDNPAHLSLPADWRVLGFGLVLTFAVTFLFGLAPALRASAVQPARALKGGDGPHSRRRLMHGLIAAQVAFCFLVLFLAGLFIGTFTRLSIQPMGFSADRILTLETVTTRPQPPTSWEQVAEALRAVPGVEKVAVSEWPLMTGETWNGYISVNGAPPTEVASYFLSVSPGWRDIMRIPLLDGRDFRAGDTLPGNAIVNRAFAKQYFRNENPVGKAFEQAGGEGRRPRFQIVGLVGDARYANMREPIQPVAYFPFKLNYSRGSFIVRTSASDPLTMASILRQEVPRVGREFRVSNIRTQKELNESHTVRERLLAMLAMFFAVVALLLSGVGLYGVLDYTVLQRRREIGIRLAIGAQAGDIARRVTVDVFSMVLTGALAGLGLGLASVRTIEALLYQVKATDLSMLAIPSVTIMAAALLAALPAIIRAVHIDPVALLRSE